jgi:hypothetical protein
VSERIEVALFGLSTAIITGFLIYGLAREEIAGPGYAVLASLSAFVAVSHAVRLALLHVNEPSGETTKGGEGS